MSASGDDPIRPEVRETMNDVARLIGDVFEGYGFMFMLFDFNRQPGEGFLNYISNAKRPDMCKVMAEFIERTKTQGLI